MVEFGEQLRRAREEKGMTQQTLAEQLYVTRQTVSHWECGDRYPDLVTTKKISQILEVSLDDLLSGNDMTKVVEKSPVVESKTANNIMIALYAIVVLSLIISAVNNVMGIGLRVAEYANMSDGMTHGIGLDSWVTVLGYIIEAVVFTIGLISAVKDTLTPKRIGLILVTAFSIMCMIYIASMGVLVIAAIIRPHEALFINWYRIARTIGTPVLITFIAAIASFFFFIKEKTVKFWPAVITVVSIAGIATCLIRCFNNLSEIFRYLADGWSSFGHWNYKDNALMLLLGITSYALLLYQTRTLYRKRKVAMDISNEKNQEA